MREMSEMLIRVRSRSLRSSGEYGFKFELLGVSRISSCTQSVPTSTLL